MENVPVPVLPADWQLQLAREAAASAASEQTESAYISTKGGVMVYGGQALKDNKIAAVILDQVWERSYYESEYQAGVFVPPTCFAVGRDEKALAPHDNAQDKQSANCATCPMAEWGSDPRPGSKAQACKLRRRLALLPADSLDTVESALSAETVGLRLPPTSTKGWSAYVSQVANVIKRPVWAVISEIKVSPHPKFQMQVGATFGGIIDEDVLAAVMAKREEIGDKYLAPWEKVEPDEEVKPPPTKGKKKY